MAKNAIFNVFYCFNFLCILLLFTFFVGNCLDSLNILINIKNNVKNKRNTIGETITPFPLNFH